MARPLSEEEEVPGEAEVIGSEVDLGNNYRKHPRRLLQAVYCNIVIIWQKCIYIFIMQYSVDIFY